MLPIILGPKAWHDMSKTPQETYVAIATHGFARDGFHGASLAALAKDAGVSKQALLHFFGTKAQLYGAVLSALNARLCDEIAQTHAPDPVAHLRAYYSRLVTSALADPQDIQLVVRALLDSDPKAQVWPLKPYLDRLTDLVSALKSSPEFTRTQALAEAYRFIGSVQYMAISLPTVQGIYGHDATEALAAELKLSVEHEIQRLTARERHG